MRRILLIYILLVTSFFNLYAAGQKEDDKKINSVAIEGSDVSYMVDNLEYEGYYISPSTNAPLVLLVHDWDGLTDYEKKRSQMLAKEGYAVFSVDLFGKGVRPTKNEDKRQHTGALYTDRAKMRALLSAGLEEAKKLGADTSRTVAMGYCFGGAAVLELARSGVELNGYATFHGGLATPEGQDYRNTKGSIIVFHGSADSAISIEDFVALNKVLETANVSNEMIAYSGTPHGFTVFDSPSYRAEADKQSWRRFLNYLEDTIKPLD